MRIHGISHHVKLRRAAKSAIPLTCFALFAILLTFYLFDKPIPLWKLQRLGWQSFDLVSFENFNSSSGPSQRPLPPNNETDWWDVEDDATEALSPTSFRLDVWNPLIPHRTGCRSLGEKECQ
jgi:hypothetical protein